MRAVMKDPDDARGGARGSSAETGRYSSSPMLERRLPIHEGDAHWRGDIAFSKEADTLTTRDRPVLPRRDTMPLSALESSGAQPPLSLAALAATLPNAPSSSEALDDEDLLLLVEDDEDDEDDDTQTEAAPFKSGDDPTSPTLSLANRSDSTREVYRLFLASDYAPALALANELIAQGEDDPMLVTIARECQATIAGAALGQTLSSADADHEPRSALRPPNAPLRPLRAPFSVFDGKMTLEQVAGMTGMSVEHVVGLLERFVAMGVLPLRPR